MHMNRDLNNLKSELEEQERDADDILKKYQNHVQNVCIKVGFYDLDYDLWWVLTIKVYIGFAPIHRFEQSNRSANGRESAAQRENTRAGGKVRLFWERLRRQDPA